MPRAVKARSRFLGRPTAAGSGKDYTEQHSYTDGANRLTYRSGGPYGRVDYNYDADGNLTHLRRGRDTTDYAYDLDNQVQNVTATRNAAVVTSTTRYT